MVPYTTRYTYIVLQTLYCDKLKLFELFVPRDQSPSRDWLEPWLQTDLRKPPSAFTPEVTESERTLGTKSISS